MLYNILRLASAFFSPSPLPCVEVLGHWQASLQASLPSPSTEGATPFCAYGGEGGVVGPRVSECWVRMCVYHSSTQLPEDKTTFLSSLGAVERT